MDELTTTELLREAATALNNYALRDAQRAQESAILNTDTPHLVPGLEFWFDQGIVSLVVAIEKRIGGN